MALETWLKIYKARTWKSVPYANNNSGHESLDIEPKGPIVFSISQVY